MLILHEPLIKDKFEEENALYTIVFILLVKQSMFACMMAEGTFFKPTRPSGPSWSVSHNVHMSVRPSLI